MGSFMGNFQTHFVFVILNSLRTFSDETRLVASLAQFIVHLRIDYLYHAFVLWVVKIAPQTVSSRVKGSS